MYAGCRRRPWRRSFRRDESFDLHQEFFPAQLTLQVQEPARTHQGGILKSPAHGVQVFRIPDIDFEERLGSGLVLETIGMVDERVQVGESLSRLALRYASMLAFMAHHAGGSGNEELSSRLRSAEGGAG